MLFFCSIERFYPTKVCIWWDLAIQGGNKLSKNFNVGMTAFLSVLFACMRRQMITTEYPNCKMQNKTVWTIQTSLVRAA